MADSAKVEMTDETTDKLHNKFQEAICLAKQCEVDTLRNISNNQDAINDKQAALNEQQKKIEIDRAALEAERSYFNKSISKYCDSMVPYNANKTLQILSIDQKNLNVLQPTNAVIGDNSNILNFGAQAEEIGDIKDMLFDLHTGVQAGNMEKDKLCETIKKLENKLDQLLVKVESLEEVIKSSNAKMIEQETILEFQKSVINQLKQIKQNLEMELKTEKERPSTIKHHEEKTYNKSTKQADLEEEETWEELAPSSNKSVEMFFEHIETLKHALKTVDDERRRTQDLLIETRQHLQAVQADNCSLQQTLKDEKQNDLNILESVKQEHMSLQREISTISKESKVKETYLQLTLEEAMQNEVLLKQQNDYFKSKAGVMKKRFLQSNKKCEEVKEKVAKLQKLLQTEQNTTREAESKLTCIVSCLQMLTDLQHGREGQEWNVDEEQVRIHLEEFIGKHKLEIGKLKKEIEKQKGTIGDKNQRIRAFEGEMKKQNENCESTRANLMSSMFEQHKLRDNIAKTQIKVETVTEELKKSEETVCELLDDNTTHQQEVEILKERIKTNEEKIESQNKDIADMNLIYTEQVEEIDKYMKYINGENIERNRQRREDSPQHQHTGRFEESRHDTVRRIFTRANQQDPALSSQQQKETEKKNPNK